MSETSLSSFSEEVSRIMPYLIRGVFKRNLDITGLGKISIPQSVTLELLDFYKSLKMKDISRNLHVSLPAATGLIDRLHGMGMVKRTYDKKDRRVIYIALTPKGNQTIKKVKTQRRKMIENLFGKLTKKERLDYLRILRKLKEAITHENLKK